MNQEQLESLPYPIFETTEEEKETLKLALSPHFSTFFLCVRLRSLGFSENRELVNKVRESLRDEEVLEYFLFGGADNYELLPSVQKAYLDNNNTAYELRNIWIRKLLAYKGE
jgi:phospholipid N-methyltransferase